MVFTDQRLLYLMLWSFRYAPEEQRHVLNQSSHRLVNPRSGAESLLNSRGESKDTRAAVFEATLHLETQAKHLSRPPDTKKH